MCVFLVDFFTGVTSMAGNFFPASPATDLQDNSNSTASPCLVLARSSLRENFQPLDGSSLLPPELWVKVAEHLSFQDLESFICVCKAWYIPVDQMTWRRCVPKTIEEMLPFCLRDADLSVGLGQVALCLLTWTDRLCC